MLINETKYSRLRVRDARQNKAMYIDAVSAKHCTLLWTEYSTGKGKVTMKPKYVRWSYGTQVKLTK